MTDRPKPPRPLAVYQMNGVPLDPFIPGWLFDAHHLTPSGVAVSRDGLKTHPKRLSEKEQAEVEEVRRAIAYYAAPTPKRRTTVGDMVALIGLTLWAVLLIGAFYVASRDGIDNHEITAINTLALNMG